MLVAKSAAPAFADQQLLTGRGEVAKKCARFSIIDDCAGRDIDNEVFSAASGLFRTAAILAGISREFFILPKRG